MTREEFQNNVTTFYDLIDFCSSAGCDLLEDVYSNDAKNDLINDELVDWARNETWRSLYEILENIPDHDGWYIMDEYSTYDWYELDDNDFLERKEEVLEWVDDNEFWDEDEDVEEEDSELELVDTNDIFAEELAIDAAIRERNKNEEVEDEDFSIGDLFDMCDMAYTAIRKADAHRIQEEKKQFDNFVVISMPKVLV